MRDAAALRPRRIALVGNPNCGKTALFNALTGARQKVGNYPGVTVERRSGHLLGDRERRVELIDLPGCYSLRPKSPDESVTCDVLGGRFDGEAAPDSLICVVDATNLQHHLRFVLELKALGRPIVVALNMIDLAERDGIVIDAAALSDQLDLPVVATAAIRRRGTGELVSRLLAPSVWQAPGGGWQPASRTELRQMQAEARRIAQAATVREGRDHRLTRQVDRVLLHPMAGPAILAGLLFLMFQAVFSWAEAPMAWIDQGVVWLQGAVDAGLPAGWLSSLLIDGVLAGVGSVIIFLPQILILFAFILLLEASGYMVRAAFLMDRLMAGVGLNGRAFIPLLSSFACAVPGIMAARTIAHPRDRLTTIMIAPLMTCSARLPVYTLIIAAFVPTRTVWGGLSQQGLVMFGLYLAGVASALLIALVLKRTLTRGRAQPLIMELPKYQLPSLRDLALGLMERTKIFLERAGRVILMVTVVLWALASFPGPPPDATEPAVYYSLAGWIGRSLSILLEPIGFDWAIATALVPGMAAREVVVAALGTVYSLSDEAGGQSLAASLQQAWSLPTALSFLAWYVFAPQCLSTLAVVRRETNSRRMAWLMAGYLFALAYLAAFVTFHLARALGG
ncbi:MAG: ferrous iron transport protein B [Rhodothalassiaceae bacterium]